MKIMKNLIRKDDYVRNKDRQDPIAVLKLSDENVIKHMKETGFVVHTLVPESTTFIQANKIGMFPGPLSLSLGPYGFLFMLTYDSATQTCKIFIKLHNSIEKIELIKSEVTANSIFNGNNYLYYCGEGTPISYISFHTKSISKMNSKNELCQFACQIGLNLIKGKKTLEDLKKIVTRNLKDIDSAYDKTDRSRSEAYFSEIAAQPVFEAMYLSKDNIIFGADSSICQFMKMAIEYDG